jgi:DNA-binding NarL/FixJ family response regulator
MTAFVHALLAWGPALLLAAGIPLGAYLYLTLQVELRLLTRRTVTRAEVDSRCGELAAELATLRVRLAAAEARVASPAAESAPQAVNLNRRGQVLRLHGKGRTAAEIAADLQISQGEVELLVKVHEWPTASVL